jgi:hypothetical protein
MMHEVGSLPGMLRYERLSRHWVLAGLPTQGCRGPQLPVPQKCPLPGVSSTPPLPAADSAQRLLPLYGGQRWPQNDSNGQPHDFQGLLSVDKASKQEGLSRLSQEIRM